jgi:hypothetical protein
VDEKQTVSQVFGMNPPKAVKARHKPAECANPDLVVGVELETERCPESRDWYREVFGNWWTVADDGSLRPPESSHEFISVPLPMGVLLPELERVFSNTAFNERNYSDRTSVHVHTNVTDYTQQQVASLVLVYTIVEDVIFRFVNHYKAPNEGGYYRDTNLYCIPWSHCRMQFGLVNTMFSDPGNAFRHWQKYTALNLLPIIRQGTVEWRHMHGTNDMEKLKIWFNIIGSIMKFAKQVEFDDVVKTVKTLNDTSAYHQFFDSVLQGSLPYEEQYGAALADGVINAKYSLINWEKYGSKPSKKKSDVFANYVGLADGFAVAGNLNHPVPEANDPARVRLREQVDHIHAMLQAQPPLFAEARPARHPVARARPAVAPDRWNFIADDIFDEVPMPVAQEGGNA